MLASQTRKNRRTLLKLGRAVAIASALSLLLSAGALAAAWNSRSAGTGGLDAGAQEGQAGTADRVTVEETTTEAASEATTSAVKGSGAPAGGASPARGPGLKERLENLDKLLHRGSPSELPTPTLVAGSRGLEKPAGPRMARGEQAKGEQVKAEPAKSEPTSFSPTPTKTESIASASEPSASTSEEPKDSEPRDHSVAAEPIREQQPAPATSPVAFVPKPDEPTLVENHDIDLAMEAPREGAADARDAHEARDVHDARDTRDARDAHDAHATDKADESAHEAAVKTENNGREMDREQDKEQDNEKGKGKEQGTDRGTERDKSRRSGHGDK